MRAWPIAAAFGLLALSGCSGGRDTHEHDSSPRRELRQQPSGEQRARRPAAREALISWPTYGFDDRRIHAVPRLALRPPFRRLWTAPGDGRPVEGPAVVDGGRVFVGTNGGTVLALDAARGTVLWRRSFDRCVAASPAVGGQLVFVPLMGAPPCHGDRGGGVVALDARTGAVHWRLAARVVETPPLLVGRTLYFGSWDHDVYAVEAGTGRVRWRFRTGDKVKSGAAYAGGTVYVGSYDGRIYALAAATGRLRWSALGGAFYATAAVAYGKVFTASTNGRIYAYSASDGRLAWSASTGSYVYSAPAISRGTVYVGSYDHRLYAFDARTGATRWSIDAGNPISGAPTVLSGLVYFSTCGSCSDFESDPQGRRSFAADVRSGRIVWRFPDGEYSPVVTDGRRIFLMGYTTVYGLEPARRRGEPAWTGR